MHLFPFHLHNRSVLPLPKYPRSTRPHPFSKVPFVSPPSLPPYLHTASPRSRVPTGRVSAGARGSGRLFSAAERDEPLLPLGGRAGAQVVVLLGRDGQVEPRGVRRVHADVAHRHLDGALAALGDVLARLVVGEHAVLQHEPARLPACGRMFVEDASLVELSDSLDGAGWLECLSGG